MVASAQVGRALTWSRACGFALLIGALSVPAQSAYADQSTVLQQMLKEGANFRVRVRAAMALGRLRNVKHAAVLERALWDRHPAVRQAAAVSLRQLAAKRSLPALRIASRDTAGNVAREAASAIRAIERKHPARSRGTAVAAAPKARKASRFARPRFAVVVGDMRNASGFQGRDLARHLRATLAEGLRENASVIVIDSSARDGGMAEARRRQLPVFRMDANLVSVKRTSMHGDLSVRCEISLLLLDNKERTIRSMLKGAATHSESPRGPRASQERVMARKAIASAVGSALGNAWKALKSASTVTRGPSYAAR